MDSLRDCKKTSVTFIDRAMRKTYILLVLLAILSFCFSFKKDSYIIYKTDSEIIYDICFTDNGEELGIADDTKIRFYSTKTNALQREFKNGHKRQILTIDISKDNNLLVSGAKDSTVVLWDFHKKKVLRRLTYPQGLVSSVKFSPDGNYILSGSTDNKAYLYSLEENKVVHVFRDHTDDITEVSFSPDGKLIITASADELVNIYEAERRKPVASLAGHNSWVRAISLSSDGRKLISCGDDSKILTWNIADVNKVQLVNTHKEAYNWLTSINLNEDGKSYVFGDIKGNVKIMYQFGSYHARVGKPVTEVLFKPNEKFVLKIALATRGKGVIMMDAKDMKHRNR